MAPAMLGATACPMPKRSVMRPKAAGASLKNSASDLKGQDRVNAWDQAIPERHQTYMEHARTVLKEMPYPPVTE